MTHKHVQFIKTRNASLHYDRDLLEHITWSNAVIHNHHEVAESLNNKHPFTITILIEPLNGELLNKKEYVKKIKFPIGSKYKELLYDFFTLEFGTQGSNEMYRNWLSAYRTIWSKDSTCQSIDDYIIKKELEPRYRNSILSRYTNHEKLFQDRIHVNRERYYRLPPPLDGIDWRTPYDNLFL